MKSSVREMDNVHYFSKKTFTTPTPCTICNKVLLGMSNQGFCCSRCKSNVHVACLSAANHHPCGKELQNNTVKTPDIDGSQSSKQSLKRAAAASKTSNKPKSNGFFSDFFGIGSSTKAGDERTRSTSSSCVPKKNVSLLSKFKLQSFAFHGKEKKHRSSSKRGSRTEINISTPTNFTHVTGTATLKLISLDAAKSREKAFYSDLERESKVNETFISEGKPPSALEAIKPGWDRIFDKNSNTFYYYNADLGITQWEKP